MSATHATTSPKLSLPAHPSLDHLRKEAKRRLGKLRTSGASAQLADAQLLVAREYGFSSWRALKAAVEITGQPPAYYRPLNLHRLVAAHAAMSDRTGVENAFYSFMAAGALLICLAISVDFGGHRAVSSSAPVVVDVEIIH